MFALLITFIISGLWHGAAWTFVIWGLLHGLYISVAVLYKPLQKKIYNKLRLNGTKILKLWKIIITFNLVSFAWIFFRAESLGDAGCVITKLFTGLGTQLGSLSVLKETLKLGLGKFDIMIMLATFFVGLVLDSSIKKFCFQTERKQYSDKSIDLLFSFRWIIYILLVISILFLGDSSSSIECLLQNISTGNCN